MTEYQASGNGLGSTHSSETSEKHGMFPLNIDAEHQQDDDRDKLPYDHSLHEKLKTIAGISGNVLEWYDFAVFGFFGDISEFLCCLVVCE